MRPLLLLLIALPALAQGQSQGGFMRQLKKQQARIQDADPALLRILPAGGFGVPTGYGMPVMNTNLCDTFVGEMTGSYVCMRGDGSFLSGGVTLAQNGTPALSTRRVCSNGADCAAPALQTSPTTSDFWRSAGNVLPPAGDFSVGAIIRTDGTAVNKYFLGLDNNIASATKLWFGVISSGTRITLRVTAAAGGMDCNVSNVLTPGAYHHVVYVFHSVGTGNSTATPYVDGVAQTACTTMNGPIDPTAVLWEAGGNAGNIGGATDTAYGSVFLTEKLLSAATILAMSQTALGTFTGSRGDAITFTRASAATATSSDGYITVVPTNRPRISTPPSGAGPGLLVEGANTTLALQTRDLSNASWTKSSMTCTKNATGVNAVASSASTCTATGANGTVLQTITTAAATRTTTFTIKGVTLTGAVYLTRDNDSTRATLDSSNCFAQGSKVATAPNTSAFVRCYVASSVLNPTVGLKIQNSGDSIVVDMANDTDSAFPVSEIIATTTSATRASELNNITTPTPTGFDPAVGCAGAVVSMARGYTGGSRPVSLSGNAGALGVTSDTQFNMFDGSLSVALTVASIQSRSVNLRSYWSGASMTLSELGVVSASGAFDGAMGSAGTVTLGGSVVPGYYLSNIRLGNTTTACDY